MRIDIVFAVLLLLTIGIILYHTVLKLTAADALESRIDDEIAVLDKIALELKDAEDAQRGYVLTGDESYLQLYQQASQKIGPRLQQLQELTATQPATRLKVENLSALIATKFAEIEQTNYLRRSQGLESAAQVIFRNKEYQISSRILPLIDQLNIEWQNVLQAQTDEAETKLLMNDRITAFGSLLTIILTAAIIRLYFAERRRTQSVLRESSERFLRMAENALDSIYRYSLFPSPRLEYINPAITAISGYSPEDFYADPQLIYKIIHPDDGQLARFLKRPLDLAGPLTLRWLHKNGTVIWTSHQLVPIYDAASNLVAIEGIVRDISERMQAYQLLEQRVEERTHEIERRRQVAEGLRDIMTILNSNRPLEEILNSILAQACGLLGSQAGAVYRLEGYEGTLHLHAAQGLEAEDVAAYIGANQGLLNRAIASRQPAVVSDTCALLAVPLTLQDETYGVIALYYAPPREISGEEIEMAVAFSGQAALAIENARLRSQAEQLAVAAERSRLARDLHDAVSQTLFSASLIADVLPRLWEFDRTQAQRRLGELRQLTRSALAEMRALLLELRPTTITEVSIGELLRQLTEAAASRIGVPVALSVDGQCQLPPDVQIAVYRIAQETLNNIARHANAAHATVRLCCGDERVEVRISDDGQGFDPTSIPPGHLGLTIMRERAKAVGVNLHIDSRPGTGTQVAVSWP